MLLRGWPPPRGLWAATADAVLCRGQTCYDHIAGWPVAGDQPGAGEGGSIAKTIGILLFDDFEELDAIGPWEVLSFWARQFPDDGWRVTTFSRDGMPVTAAKGLVVHPEHSYETVPPLNVFIYPGGARYPCSSARRRSA